jgi:hypothetical protein
MGSTVSNLASTFVDLTEVTQTRGGETNLKLEAQKIKDFSGAHDDWAKWKSRTECAFSGSGYERILEDETFALSHERLNRVVYSQLASATVDGVAYHLVQQFEENKNGHAAWANLIEWYDGEMIKSETATNLRNKIENLQLNTSVSGSEYVNKFLAWHRDLEKIKGEGMSASHSVGVFLRNITDPDYSTTVTYCLNSDCNLEKCVNAIRKQERDIQQKKLARYRFKATLRRMKNKHDESDDDDSTEPKPKRMKPNKVHRVESQQDKAENSKFEGELDTTEKGLLRFKSDCWKKMDEKEKDFVREYNAAIKHGDPIGKISLPTGISVKQKVRRTQLTPSATGEPDDRQKGKEKKKKGVTFGISDADHVDHGDE